MDFAGLFFRDINSMIIEYIPLQVCKITDPPKTGGKDNLTVKYINQQLKLAGIAEKVLEEIAFYSTAMHSYREKILQGRKKVVSHSDKEVALSGEPVGAHEAEDVVLFFQNLFAYTDAVGNAIGVGPLDYNTIPGEGDVIGLIRNIREWDRLRREN